MKAFVLAAISSLLIAFLSNAYADDQFNLEALGGWGFPRAYHAEVGTRVGYFFENNIYSGLDYTHFFSGSHRFTSSNMVSAELGYRIMVTQIELVPYMGLGAAMLSEKTSSYDRLLVNPGLKISYPIGPVMVGLDNQYMIVPNHNAFAMAGTVGFRF
jgi:hypothetical protein